MDEITHEMRLKKWIPIISECRKSGLSVRAWCQENGVNEKQLYYWQRRIRQKVVETPQDTQTHTETKFAQLPIPIEPSNTSAFKADAILHIGNNILEISNTTSEDLLSMILKVMSNVK